ncbi:MAG: hypothetical protein U0074_16525 [Kouleothrix sp.]|jgi:hypothetical protein
MLQQVDFFGWVLQIDQQATHEAYNQLPANWDCMCGYCRNFRAALSVIPGTFRTALEDMGINLLHPAEAIEYPNSTTHLHVYEAWYHMVGYLRAAPSSLLDQYGRREIISGVDVCVSDTLDLLPKGFPTPAIQVRFFVSLPWVLDEADT